MDMLLEDLWLKKVRTQMNSDWNLICFPFLCGFAESFLPWQKLLSDCKLYAVQLPGRASREQEPHITNIDDLLDILLPILLPILESKPYVLFGHSMGGYLAYRTARKLHEIQFKAPLLLVVSGTSSPTRLNKQKRNSDSKTIKNVEVSFKKRTPSAIELQYLKEMQYSIQWDKLLLKSCAVNTPAKLNYPILLMAGSEDNYVLAEDVIEWKKETTSYLSHQVIEGVDHYSLEKDVILNRIKQEINRL